MAGNAPTPQRNSGNMVGQEANGQRHEGARRRRRRGGRGGRGGQNRMGGAPGQQRNDRPQAPMGSTPEHQYPDGNRAEPMPGFRSAHESTPVASESIERMPEGNVAPIMTHQERPTPPVARDESHSATPPATPAPPSERIVMVETRTEPPSGEQKPS
ncbi:MAG: hypothetical protein HZA69_08135 [Gammaproteobacteria bacterium]|nr:hypothetical protein [Gammaproteobacteria bacterium]